MELISDIDYGPILQELIIDLNNLSCTWANIENASINIYSFFQESYNKILNCQNVERQQDEEFRNSLFDSIENIIMAVLHEKLFTFISEQTKREDELFYKKCCELSSINVTPDQLGALIDYSIPLPATVVEVAALDMHELPSEKLTCLSTAFDLALAELKGAMVDVIALTSDNAIPVLNVADITPILATIIVHAKPLHFIANLYYIQYFRWSKLSSTENECLLAFKTAVDKLKVVTADMLLPRNKRIYCDISSADMIQLQCDVETKFGRNGQRISAPDNPLDYHIEQFTKLIAQSTLERIEIFD